MLSNIHFFTLLTSKGITKRQFLYLFHHLLLRSANRSLITVSLISWPPLERSLLIVGPVVADFGVIHSGRIEELKLPAHKKVCTKTGKFFFNLWIRSFRSRNLSLTGPYPICLKKIVKNRPIFWGKMFKFLRTVLWIRKYFFRIRIREKVNPKLWIRISIQAAN